METEMTPIMLEPFYTLCVEEGTSSLTVKLVTVKRSGETSVILGRVDHPVENAQMIINQPGPLDNEDIDAYVDWRNDDGDIESWPSKAVFSSERRAILTAIKANEEKLVGLSHVAELWDRCAPELSVEDDIMVENTVEEVRVELHAEIVRLNSKLAA
tara:strand:- start:404 stop:874 length:471 start_codon:yes stop_codon:yes gene_type:complete